MYQLDNRLQVASTHFALLELRQLPSPSNNALHLVSIHFSLGQLINVASNIVKVNFVPAQQLEIAKQVAPDVCPLRLR